MNKAESKSQVYTWFPLSLSPDELRLEVTLICGQVFRWKKFHQDSWIGVVGPHVFALKESETDVLYSHMNGESSSDKEDPKIKEILLDYFQTKYSLSKLFEDWSKRDAEFKNMTRFRGLRLIRQDPLECIFSFICSSNNNIQRITKMIDGLCKKYGNYICEVEGERYYQFPTLQQLLTVEEQDLRNLGFGYRAKYIVQTAKQINEKGSDWLNQLRAQTKKEAHKGLTELMGIGRKVADCICLFSLDKLECIPVDTHVWQIAQRYLPKLKAKKLNDQIYEEIGTFFLNRLGTECGWAHTILFANELSFYKKSSPNPKQELVDLEDKENIENSVSPKQGKKRNTKNSATTELLSLPSKEITTSPKKRRKST